MNVDSENFKPSKLYLTIKQYASVHHQQIINKNEAWVDDNSENDGALSNCFRVDILKLIIFWAYLVNLVPKSAIKRGFSLACHIFFTGWE